MGCHSSQLKETKETNVDSNILLSVLYVWVGQIVFLVHSSLDQETHYPEKYPCEWERRNMDTIFSVRQKVKLSFRFKKTINLGRMPNNY